MMSSFRNFLRSSVALAACATEAHAINLRIALLSGSRSDAHHDGTDDDLEVISINVGGRSDAEDKRPPAPFQEEEPHNPSFTEVGRSHFLKLIPTKVKTNNHEDADRHSGRDQGAMETVTDQIKPSGSGSASEPVCAAHNGNSACLRVTPGDAGDAKKQLSPRGVEEVAAIEDASQDTAINKVAAIK